MTLKERLVKEALMLFSTKGYMNTSITAVMERAGSSKGGLYNHFKSQEEHDHWRADRPPFEHRRRSPLRERAPTANDLYYYS